MSRTPLQAWAGPSQKAKFVEIWNRRSLRLVAELLQSRGLGCLLVGGVVRDLVLDVSNDDVDLVVNGTPEELFSNRDYLAAESGATAVPLDRERGILRLVFASGDELDLVSRKGESLLEDLSRRDFTVNSLALDADGTLVDPYGGFQDLQNRLLRSVSRESFEDDPLRVVRGIRFSAQLKATIEPQTFQSMSEALHLLERVAGERVSTELRKFFPHARAKDLALLYRLDLAAHLFGSSSTSEPLILEARPTEFSLALSVWLDSKALSVKEMMERLRVSRVEGRYIEHYRAGEAWLVKKAPGLSVGDIYDLYGVAKETFLDLARLLQCTHFQSALDEAERKRVLLEASHQGDLNWAPFPWNGNEIAETVGKSPGPWMGKVLNQAKKAWACGELTELVETARFLD